jgi:hypothetical protein
MSQENVDLFYLAVAAMNHQDVDAFLAVMDDQVDAVPRIAAVDGAFRGPEGIRRWWDGLYGVFPDLTVEVAEVRDLGELTVAGIRLRGSAVGSDIPIDEGVWHVAWWQHGRCIRWGLYDTEAQALEAAGLSE